MFKAIINFLKSLFGLNKTYVETKKEDVTTEEVQKEEEKKVEDEVEPMIQTDAVPGEEKCENCTEEVKCPEHVAPSTEDKEYIANILRPIVKSLNDSAEYLEAMGSTVLKKMKVYATLEEDHIEVRFTMSETYNSLSEFGEFVINKIFMRFTEALNNSDSNCNCKHYEASCKNGVITIYISK